MKDQIGTRVIALQRVEAGVVYSFGAGIYEGDFPRPGSTDYPTGEDLTILETVIKEYDTPEGRKKHLDFVEAAWRSTPKGEKPLTEDEVYKKVKEAAAKYDERAKLSFEDRVKEVWLGMQENPRIKLDNGGYCWGFECWWGPEDKTKEKYPEPQFEWVEVKPVYNTA